MDLTYIKQIFDLIAWGVVAIIGAAGVFYGIYSVWDGFTNDKPDDKKRGWTILLITVIAVAMLIVAKSIIWNMISSGATTL